MGADRPGGPSGGLAAALGAGGAGDGGVAAVPEPARGLAPREALAVRALAALPLLPLQPASKHSTGLREGPGRGGEASRAPRGQQSAWEP